MGYRYFTTYSPFFHQRWADMLSLTRSLTDEEIWILLTAQDILAGLVPSLADLPIILGHLHMLAHSLFVAKERGGEPLFWREYEALATSYSFLYDWKDFVASSSPQPQAASNSSPQPQAVSDTPATSEQQATSNSSVALQQQAVSDEAPNGQADEPGILVSQVTRQAVDWFWKLLVPQGKLTLLDGDPDTGKSLLLCDLAARLTRGWAMPDGTPGIRGGVVIIAPEDDLSDTIQPRLERAGADLSKIVCLNEVEERDSDGTVVCLRPFLLTQDLDILEAAILRVQAKLVILDPLTALLGRREISKDGEVRVLLAPLQRLVARMQVACIMVRHLVRRGNENTLYRGIGSIAFIALARSGLLVVHDPADQTRQVLIQCKNNLGLLAQSIAYRISDDKDKGDDRPYVAWEGPSPLTAKDLGSPANAVLGATRQAILDVLKEHGGVRLTPQQIAEKLPGMSIKNIRNTLKRMVDDGQISQLQRGVYTMLSA